MRWDGLKARIGKTRNACNIWVGKSVRRWLRVRFRRSWEGNVENVFRGMGLDTVDWIHLTRDRDSVTWRRTRILRAMKDEHLTDTAAAWGWTLLHYWRQVASATSPYIPHVPAQTPGRFVPWASVCAILISDVFGLSTWADTIACIPGNFAQVKSYWLVLGKVEVRVPAVMMHLMTFLTP
jgi:hypothetical protein